MTIDKLMTFELLGHNDKQKDEVPGCSDKDKEKGEYLKLTN